MICRLVHCETKHGNFCCAKCEFKGSCKNACLNKPKECGYFVKPVNDFNFMKHLVAENKKAAAGINECCELLNQSSIAVNQNFDVALESLQEISVKLIEMNYELKRYLGAVK